MKLTEKIVKLSVLTLMIIMMVMLCCIIVSINKSVGTSIIGIVCSTINVGCFSVLFVLGGRILKEKFE